MPNFYLYELIRKKLCVVLFNQPYNDKWNDEEIYFHISHLKCSGRLLITLPNLPNCIELYCNDCRLTILPDLSNCKKLECYGNHLTKLPDLPNCIELNCNSNKLISLPNLPQCKKLLCMDNDLITLPELPNCELLSCSQNKLSYIPHLPKCKKLYCRMNFLKNIPNLYNCNFIWCCDNQLFFNDGDDYTKLWKFIKLYLHIKYFRLWYKFVLRSKANRKKELHLELLYSPNLPFYKNTDEYKHFNSTQNYLDILPD